MDTMMYRDRVAEEFIQALKEEPTTWKKGWNSTGAQRNGVSGYEYKGLNLFYLSMVARKRGYDDPRWYTFLQIKEKGYKLKNAKGQGVRVEYWYPYDKVEKKSVTWQELRLKTNGDFGGRFILRVVYSVVFNATLIENVEPLEKPDKKRIVPSRFVTKVSKGMGIELLQDGGDHAYYNVTDDSIHLPPQNKFKTSYDYAATALHELAHAAGAEHRLNRGLKDINDMKGRAYEELIAEISSCFTVSGISAVQTKRHMENHKAYVQAWIFEVERSPSVLISAIKEAQKVAAYIDWKGGLISEEEYKKTAESNATKEGKAESDGKSNKETAA